MEEAKTHTLTRSQVEALIEHAAGAVDYGIEISDQQMADILFLARLGVSVAAPRDDEIEAMAKAMFTGYEGYNTETRNDMERRERPYNVNKLRRALSALRESKP